MSAFLLAIRIVIVNFKGGICMRRAHPECWLSEDNRLWDQRTFKDKVYYLLDCMNALLLALGFILSIIAGVLTLIG